MARDGVGLLPRRGSDARSRPIERRGELVEAREAAVDVERRVGVARDERRADRDVDALVGQRGELLERGGPRRTDARAAESCRRSAASVSGVRRHLQPWNAPFPRSPQAALDSRQASGDRAAASHGQDRILRSGAGGCAAASSSARDVRPRAITGQETPHEILTERVPGLRRAPGAHRLRAHAAQRRAGLRDLPHVQRRDDARRAAPVVPHPAARARPRRLHHDDGRQPLPRRPPHHRPPHPRDRPDRRATCSTASRASSASTTSASGRRRCSRPTGSSRRCSAGPSSRSG